MRRHVLTLALALAGCQAWDADLEKTIAFGCAKTNECPDGQSCVAGRCVAAEQQQVPPACTTAAQCDDGNACTQDRCDATGQCVHTPAPSDTTCRAAAGPCDEPERCDGSSTTCPADALKPATFVCRNAAGDCDEPELCTGSGVACPADAVKPATFVCRNAAGDCDEPELCTGSGVACPADALKPATFVCRNAAGECDEPELCTGSGVACPADVLAALDKPCTSDNNTCTSDRCLGTDVTCHHTAVSEGLACTGGVCVAGSCSSGCWIGSAFVASGALNPANECEACDPAVATQWSVRANQTPCTGAGNYCNLGTCMPHCSIAATLYPDGTVKPDNPCARCDTATSSSGWTTTLPPSLVGYWPLDEGTGIATADLTGHQNGTLEGSAALPSWQTDSVHGSALKFDSTSVNDVPRVSLGTYDPTAAGKVTVSLWFKAAAGATGGLQFAKGNDLADGSWRVYTGTTETGPWTLMTSVTKSLAPTWVASAAGVASAGTWHHHVAVIDGTAMKIYLDGVEKASGTVTLGVGDPTGTLWLGAQSRVGSYPFPYHGLLDEVSVWNRALAPSEVVTLYNNGSYFPACWARCSPEGGACNATQVCHLGYCQSGCFIGGSFYASGAVNPANACQVCTPTLSTTTWSASIPAGLVGYWPLDEGTGTTTADLTGTQDGTLEGSPTLPSWQVDSVHGSALKFDSTGVNDVPRVSLGTYDPAAGGKVTVSLWFKGTAGGTGGLQFAKGTDLSEASWRVYTGTTETGPWTLMTSVTKSLAPTWVASAAGVASAGAWHHHVTVYDGTAVKIYLDGVEKASGTVTLGPGDAAGALWLGAQNRVGTYPFPYHGLLDEVSVWNRVLTAAEVASLYNGGTYVAACGLGR